MYDPSFFFLYLVLIVIWIRSYWFIANFICLKKRPVDCCLLSSDCFGKLHNLLCMYHCHCSVLVFVLNFFQPMIIDVLLYLIFYFLELIYEGKCNILTCKLLCSSGCQLCKSNLIDIKTSLKMIHISFDSLMF